MSMQDMQAKLRQPPRTIRLSKLGLVDRGRSGAMKNEEVLKRVARERDPYLTLDGPSFLYWNRTRARSPAK